jgi:putative heme-binding domain-containing protein
VAAFKGDGMLSALAGALTEPLVPEEVKRALTVAIAGDAAQSRAAVEVALQSASLRVQLNLAQKLAANPAGAELLLALAEAGKFAPRVLAERVVKDRLAATKPANWEARVAKLIANLPPADEARQKLIDERKAAFDRAKADKANGVAVFTQACAVCHQLGGQGALVGPQLDGIGNRGLERLLEDILDPNRNVDHAFRSQIVVLKDGDVVSGLVRREEGAVLVMADATGKELQIEKTKIASRRESESSLMPENFHEALTAEQLRDLVGYLLGSSANSVSR